MIKTPIALLAVALLAGLSPAQAAYFSPVPMGASAAHNQHELSPAELAQWAAEDGITVEQAKQLTLAQLAWLKNRRDGNDDNGAYWTTSIPNYWSAPR